MYQKQRPETQRFNPKRTDTLTHLAANRGQRYIPEYKFEQKKKAPSYRPELADAEIQGKTGEKEETLGLGDERNQSG
ncbi:unnamed protein product [Arabidopsis thaliana]|jgi:hypothetical protein|uniref:Uncharacterized protein n=1 Tax=Arabidopsis thaliana TaxID=3702 RepID=A0A654G0D8_ARATH|nr:unnamed protein product [Arabidopsis thaliana]